MNLGDMPISGKKKGGKRGKKRAAEEEEEEEETIRCVCGVTSDDGTGDAWIACDNCGVWQHNVCVGVSTFDDEIPKNYMCEECDPTFHEELLNALARGEKLWEVRKIEFQEGTKKKGKRGKAKRASEGIELIQGLIQGANGKAKSPSTPIQEVKKKDTPAKGGSSKRKGRDESQDKESAKVRSTQLLAFNMLTRPKVRKVSAAHITPKQKSPPSGLPTKMSELDVDRAKIANLIFKALKHTIPIAVKTGLYAYSPGDTLDTKAERLAIQIEDAIRGEQPSTSYTNQCRKIVANLKTNQELCNGLLNHTLTPKTLAGMTSDDMASQELKQQTAEMKARADKASIMITEDEGPRIRRTHKGDEIVEGDDGTVANDIPLSSRQRRRSMLDPNADMATRSRENSPANDVPLPTGADYRSQDDIRGHVPPKAPLNVDTKRAPVRKSSQPNFDYNSVLQSVPAHSPTGTSHIRRPSGNVVPKTGPGDDPDIDRLLQDDGNESPPYSPAEYDSDPEIIWKGMVDMDSIAKFPAVAKHVGGADVTRTANPPMTWGDILQKDLRVAGRIDQDKANEYLCSLRYSPPTDVVVVNITPTGELAVGHFNDMFHYFHSKNRYGVLTNKGIGNIRDTYLVPVPASPGALPDFIINLEGHRIPEDRPENMILVALVIRNNWEEQHHQSFNTSMDAQSPSIQNHHVRQLSISGTGTGPAMSPIAPPNASFPNIGPPPHHPPQLSREDIQRRQEQEMAQRQGEETARAILGHHAQAPTVGFLMPQAFQMRALEWEVIKGILETDEKARIDLSHLSTVLEHRMSQQPQPQQQQTQPAGPPPPQQGPTPPHVPNA
jgi:hypothetical protein